GVRRRSPSAWRADRRRDRTDRERLEADEEGVTGCGGSCCPDGADSATGLNACLQVIRPPTECIDAHTVLYEIVATTYSIPRCLHHISAALRFRCASSESTRLGSFTSMTALRPSSYSTMKSGRYRR